ncbi:MAG: DNA topoisomerase [Ruminococcus sp.]|jgi:DNA gyrase subunit B|nr:DNA topoisomerase [Ruminococcus sp.]
MLKGADRVRKRPAVIFGSDGIDGAKHAFFEVLSNSIDEARGGHGNLIKITRYNDCSIEIEDFGRGCPVDFNEHENRFNWELIYCELYAGGKFDNNADGQYDFSLGLNGLGACATQYSAEYMDVTVYRDGCEFSLHFEHGENVGGMQKKPYKKSRTGTVTRWKSDLEVFTDIEIEREYFEEIIKKQAIVNSGIRFEFSFENEDGIFEKTEFLYENGIKDYIAEIAGESFLTPPHYIECERKGRDREDKDDYRVKITCAFAFSNKTKRLEYYHNSSFLEHGGSPDKAVKNAFVYQIDSYMKQNNKYLKNESKITFADVEECLIFIYSGFSTLTSYENQTKKAINNRFIYEAMTEFLRHQLEVYFIENPDFALRICEQIMLNKRSRESAEKTRLNLKKKLAGNIDLSNMVEKFVDCRTKDLSRREIYIVEGDSALGSCKTARNAEFQAIIPVRGKILNCLKADYARIFKSEIITDLLKVLGCGVEVSAKSNKDISSFNLDNLKWNKIIICTDADVDGFQIRTLILTMLYRLTPTLINEGFVYIAESPLFEITTKDKTYFAYSEKEKADIIKTIGDKKYKLDRSKGLGENDADMMSLTTMNPATRRLIRVLPAETEDTSWMFDMLLGDNLQGRKDYISENGYRYLDLADVS